MYIIFNIKVRGNSQDSLHVFYIFICCFPVTYNVTSLLSSINISHLLLRILCKKSNEQDTSGFYANKDAILIVFLDIIY